MAEAAVMALDLLVMLCACWVVVRVSRKPRFKASDLGVFAYKDSTEEPPP